MRIQLIVLKKSMEYLSLSYVNTGCQKLTTNGIAVCVRRAWNYFQPNVLTTLTVTSFCFYKCKTFCVADKIKNKNFVFCPLTQTVCYALQMCGGGSCLYTLTLPNNWFGWAIPERIALRSFLNVYFWQSRHKRLLVLPNVFLKHNTA